MVTPAISGLAAKELTEPLRPAIPTAGLRPLLTGSGKRLRRTPVSAPAPRSPVATSWRPAPAGRPRGYVMRSHSQIAPERVS